MDAVGLVMRAMMAARGCDARTRDLVMDPAAPAYAALRQEATTLLAEADCKAAMAGTVADGDARWLTWRGACEGMDQTVACIAKGIRQCDEAKESYTAEQVARNAAWMAGLDHLWAHVEALRAALGVQQAPHVSRALRAEADRLLARADELSGAPRWECAARARPPHVGAPAECEWPLCSCDPYAERVVGALRESGALPDGLGLEGIRGG